MVLKVDIVIMDPHSRRFTDASEVSKGGGVTLIFQKANKISFCLIMVVELHGSNVFNVRECLDLTKHIMNDRKHVMNLTDVSEVRRGGEGGNNYYEHHWRHLYTMQCLLPNPFRG